MNKPDLKILAFTATGVSVLVLLLWNFTGGAPSRKEAAIASSPREPSLGSPAPSHSSRSASPMAMPAGTTDFFNRTALAATDSLTERQEPVGRKVVIALGETGDHELEVVLAPGVREPVAMLEPAEEMSPAQLAALDNVLENFVNRVEEAAGSSNNKALAQAWEKEKAEADASYRVLFGDSAVHQQTGVAASRAQNAAAK